MGFTLKPGAVNGTSNRLWPRAGPQGAARQPRIPQGPKKSASSALLPSARPRLAESTAAPGAERGAEKARAFSPTPEPRPAASGGLLEERARRRTSCSQSGPAACRASAGTTGLLRERAGWQAGRRRGERTAWSDTDGVGQLAGWLQRERTGCMAD